MTAQDHFAVVTGAGSGIGRATATLLAQRGWYVLVGVRKLADGAAVAARNIEPVVLDITEADQIDALVRRIDADPAGRQVSVLVNNAGINVNAPIETFAIGDWRRHFEVNFFGHVAITKALLPALVAAQGRVVNVSSIGGRVALPTYGCYSASKFALEAFSDVLRRELGRFGLTVIVIEPGTVVTSIWDKALAAMRRLSADWTVDEHERYDPLIATMTGQAEAVLAGGRGVTAADAARVIVDAVVAEVPLTRYLIGDDAESLAQAANRLSDWDLDRLLTAPDGKAD